MNYSGLKVGLVSLATLATFVGAMIYKSSVHKADFEGGKKVQLKCKCGKFSASVVLPKKESQSAGLRVFCHCEDCVKWAKQAVKTSGLDPETGGDEMLLVHKATVKVDTPELVECCKLYSHSVTHRYKTTCCETSIGSCRTGFSIFALNTCIVEDKQQLIERLDPITMHIRLGEAKKKTERFANDPNAFESVAGPVKKRYMKFALSGQLEMVNPSPLPENSVTKKIMFPESN